MSTVPDTRTRTPPDRKATLFCPACDHVATVGGDWVVDAGGDRRRIACPECGHTVVSQPRY